MSVIQRRVATSPEERLNQRLKELEPGPGVGKPLATQWYSVGAQGSSFQNNWAHYPGTGSPSSSNLVQFCKDANNWVHFRGLVAPTSGNLAVWGLIGIQMGAGWRCDNGHDSYFTLSAYQQFTNSYIAVPVFTRGPANPGAISLVSPNNLNVGSYVSLDGLSYLAEA